MDRIKSILRVLATVILAIIGIFLFSFAKNYRRALNAPAHLAPQFILLSFDGGKSIDVWEDTLNFSKKLNSEGKPVHFTYFINAAYFLAPENAKSYAPPLKPRGTSIINFSEDASHIDTRVKEVNRAILEGHEIASHLVGHFSGKSWNKNNWEQEFDSFDDIMSNIESKNPGLHLGQPSLLEQNPIRGFRAPYLHTNTHMYEVLHERKFAYDASEVSKGHEWPTIDTEGLWHIPYSTVEIGDSRTPVTAMDALMYDLHDHEGKGNLKRGTAEWNAKKEEVLKSYRDYFKKSYGGNRAPISIGYHFWIHNDGLYWEALKEFASEACGKPDVRCTTFSEFVTYLNSQPDLRN
ncbi:MAG: hypothetical protein JWO73_573 [Candidatus Taylorbacteria bacterium]|nr:hypothetical protein [Candidatus Taylorbacteria bacterium]